MSLKLLIFIFALKRGTERLVKDLKKSAQFVEERLEIKERSENLLPSSKDIHDSSVLPPIWGGGGTDRF